MSRNILRVSLLGLFGLVLLILVVIYMSSMFKDFFTKDAPYVGSFNYQLDIMKKELNLLPGKKLVDLGCGDGRALRFFDRHFYLQQLHGYELKYLVYLRGRCLNIVLGKKNIQLYHQSFLAKDLKKYDYIYIYLLPNQLERIEERIFSSINKDAIVISNSFKFKKRKAIKILKSKKGRDLIFLYKSAISK